MKKYLLLALGVCMVFSISAQEERGTEPIMENSNIIYGFGGPIVMMSSIHNNFVVFMGGGGGLLINDFMVGGFGFGQSTSVKAWPCLGSENRVSLSGGGLWLGYSFLSDKVIHPSVDLLLGWGSVNLYQNSFNAIYDSNNTSLMMLIPRFNAELSVTDFFHIAMGVEYRSVFLMKTLPCSNNSDFSSLGLAISFKFGGFGR